MWATSNSVSKIRLSTINVLNVASRLRSNISHGSHAARPNQKQIAALERSVWLPYVPSASRYCEQPSSGLWNLSSHYRQALLKKVAHIECWCCDRMFSTIPGMLIHLESGSCAHGVEAQDVNHQAATCYQWKWWMDHGLREALMEGAHTDLPLKGLYHCHGCLAEFSSLSGLYQHITSPACRLTLDDPKIKKLTRWLTKSLPCPPLPKRRVQKPSTITRISALVDSSDEEELYRQNYEDYYRQNYSIYHGDDGF